LASSSWRFYGARVFFIASSSSCNFARAISSSLGPRCCSARTLLSTGDVVFGII
jgi:hypothetical protein